MNNVSMPDFHQDELTAKTKDDSVDMEIEFYNIPDKRIIDMLVEARAKAE